MRPEFVRRAAACVLSLSVVAGGFLTGGLRGPATAQAATGAITGYAPRSSAEGSRTILALAPVDDGSLWFAANGSDRAGILARGAQPFNLSTVLHHPAGVVQGPGGHIFVTNAAPDAPAPAAPVYSIAEFSRNGTFVQSIVETNPGDIDVPAQIVLGPDNALWWVNQGNDTIGRYDAATGTTHFTAPVGGISGLGGIVVGPDQAIWFTSTFNDRIGRLTLGGSFTFHDNVSGAMSAPTSITLGPDQALYFTNNTDASIGRFDPKGGLSKLAGAGITTGRQITTGPDGNLWYTSENKVVRLTTGGVATAFTASTFSTPYAIAFGADNAIWVSDVGDGSKDSVVYRITTGGAIGGVKPFALGGGPLAMSTDGALWMRGGGRMTSNGALRNPIGIGVWPESVTPGRGTAHQIWGMVPGTTTTDLVGLDLTNDQILADKITVPIPIPRTFTVGPDKNLWFAGAGYVKRYNLPSGTIDTFAYAGIQFPASMTVGPDGNLWFVDYLANQVDRVAMNGTMTPFANVLVSTPVAIAPGRDGALWFTNNGNNRIGRITPSGAFTFFTAPSVNLPTSITAGPDGALWFANGGSPNVGRITTGGVVTTYPVGPFGATISDVSAGPDGAVWASTATPSSLVRVNVVHDITAPVATAPKAGFATETGIRGSSVSAAVTWTASDAGGSGLDRYELGVQRDGGAWTWVSRLGISRTASPLLANGHTYRFRVRAVDKAGNVGAFAYGPTFKASIAQQTTPAATYSSGWSSQSSSLFSGGSAKYSKKSGASVTYRFTGRGVAWAATFGPTQGKAKVYVDGVYVKTVDTYEATPDYGIFAYSRTWSSVGTHTLKIVVLGTAGRPRVDVDAFAVYR